jgi:hypothetical protein
MGEGLRRPVLLRKLPELLGKSIAGSEVQRDLLHRESLLTQHLA